ncbi:helix-turn-helix domain-containing protein, partial [Weissella cibaria]
MTRISKQTKFKAIQEYFLGVDSKKSIARRYGMDEKTFGVLIAAYETHGPDVLFNPPKVTAEFRITLASWAIRNNASYTEIASKFGYTGTAQ